MNETVARTASCFAHNISKILPEIGRKLADEYLDMRDPAQIDFVENGLDDPTYHDSEWHQFGIISHSQAFVRYLFVTMECAHVPFPILEVEIATKRLQKVADFETDDGPGRLALLELAGALHDVGKFAVRRAKNDGSYSYAGHEKVSGELIRRDDFIKYLPNCSRAEQEYVAKCAELHFELGKVRKSAKLGGGYTPEFAKTTEFQVVAEQIIKKNKDFALEIGLMFLADSLAKTTVASIDEFGNPRSREEILADINRSGENPKLVSAVLQMPTNIAVAREYLRLALERA